MAARRVDCFLLDLENRPGAFARFTRQMREEKISFRGLSGHLTATGKGKIACIPQNSRKFLEAARKLGISTTQVVAFYVSGTDKAGALCPTLDSLAKEGINIEALEAIGISGRFGSYIWVDPKDASRAADILGA